jgi:FkbM family methyltransferase
MRRFIETPLTLSIKSAIVGTIFERPLLRARKAYRFIRQLRHPEIFDLYLEEDRIAALLQRQLSRDSCCIDGGAHIGSFLGLLYRYAPLGRHIAFEPSHIKAQRLVRKFSRAEIHECALVDVDAPVRFEEDIIRPGYSRVRPVIGSDVTPNCVNGVRLDTICADLGRLDLIKLDIEGAELAALCGSTKTISRFHPIILFEFGTEYDVNLNRRAIYDLLQEFGYSIFTLVDFLHEKGPLSFDEFRKCGLYPFRAFNFVAQSNKSN